jgi:hypothetical protein
MLTAKSKIFLAFDNPGISRVRLAAVSLKSQRAKRMTVPPRAGKWLAGTKRLSFDQFVGAQDEVRRNLKADFLCESQIDDKLEFARLFDWNVASGSFRVIFWQVDDRARETYR